MANKTWKGDDSGNEGNYGTAANWEPSGVPGAGDNVRLTADFTQDITATLDQSAVAIGDFIVEEGYTGAIGTVAADLQIDPNRFEFAGAGTSFIDLGTAAISCQVHRTKAGGTGTRGLYLKGSAIATLTVKSGSVGLASRHGDTATITTAVLAGASADVWIGEGVTLTNLYVNGGACKIRSAATAVYVYGGMIETEEEGAITTINQFAGTATLNSTGTVTTINHDGGVVDLSQSGAARTITTYSPEKGAALIDNPIVVITNYNRTAAAARISFT